jgi:glycerol-3-phosphate dehydrogenase (NAD(P)+)
MTAEPYSRIAILGGGAWGTALAVAAHAAGRSTSLWAREDDVVATIARDRENKRFLPGVALPKELVVTGDLSHGFKPMCFFSPRPRKSWEISRARSSR